jgi:hypothetical protein
MVGVAHRRDAAGHDERPERRGRVCDRAHRVGELCSHLAQPAELGAERRLGERGALGAQPRVERVAPLREVWRRALCLVGVKGFLHQKLDVRRLEPQAVEYLRAGGWGGRERGREGASPRW